MNPIEAPASFLDVIQLSITPVMLISGLGALVISMTTRMGRIVDRSRALAGLVRTVQGEDRVHIEHQLEIMFRRAKIMRLSMTLVASSMFMSGVLIMLLFVSGISKVVMPGMILGVFVVSVTLMLGGLAVFIRDVFVSLQALGLEVKRALGHE